MTSRLMTHRACAAIAAAATLTFLSLPNCSATVTWDGGGSSPAWSTVNNWSTNSLPANTDDLLFGSGFSSGTTISLGSARTASSISINTNTSFALGSPSSPNLTITSATISTTGTSGEQDVLPDLYTSAGSGWVITVANANDTLGLGNLYQTGSGSRPISLYGAGKITLSSDSNMTGGIAIFGPTVTIPGNTTLPDVTVNSGTAIVTGDAATQNYSIMGAGNGSLGPLQGNDAVINNLTLKSNSTITGTSLSLSGSLSDGNNGYLLTDKASFLTLSKAASNFTGTLNVLGGTLDVAANSVLGSPSVGSLNLAANATLQLEYQTTLNKAVTLAAGTTVVPVFNATMAGSITVAGNPSFGSSTEDQQVIIHSTITDSSSSHSGITILPASNVYLDGSNNTFHNGVTMGADSVLVLVSNNAAGTGPVTGPVTSLVQLGGNITLPNSFTVGDIENDAGNNTLTGPVKLLSQATTLDIADGSTVTISGVISNATTFGALTKNSPGRLVLSVANTYDGGTEVTDGAIAISNGAALGTGLASFFKNGPLDPVLEISGSITGSTPLQFSSNQTLAAITPIMHATSGNNSWTGSIDLTGYTQISVDPGATLALNGPVTSAAGVLVKGGGGTLSLGGAGSYDFLSAQLGTVAITSSSAAPSTMVFNTTPTGSVALSGGISSAAVINLTGTGFGGQGSLRGINGSSIQTGPVHLLTDSSIGVDTNSTLAINSIIDDAGLGYTLTKVGNGTLSLNNSNNYSGGTVIAGGTLRISADAQLGLASSPVTINNAATFRLGSSFTTSRTINANNGSLLPESGVITSLANAYLNGGNLRGPGSFTLSSNTTLNTTTSLQGATLNQTGPASLLTFTNGGTLTNSAALTWDTGSNAATGTLTLNSTLATSNFANYGVLTISSGATLTNSISPFVAASGSRTTISVGGTLTSSQPLSLSSLLTNNGTLSGAPLNIFYGGLATGTGSWPAVNLSPGGTFSPGGAQAPSTPNFTTTAYLQPTPGNLSVPAPVTLLADTIADVTNSTDSLTLTSQLTAAGVTLTKIHPGTLSLTNLRAAGLVATDGTLAILPAHTASSTSSLNSLTITGTGHFDLADNNLVLDYTGSSPLTTLRQYLQTNALTSSSATSNPNHITALGYAEASQLPPTTAAQIAGTLPYDSTTLLIKYTYEGDANLDGKITADDYALLDKGFAQHLSTWTFGDFNYDGVVDQNDYLLIDKTVTLQSGTYAPSASLLAAREAQFGDAYVQSLLTSIPEPASPLACLFATIPLLRRRPNQ